MENYTTTQTMENSALNMFFFRSCRVLCSLLRIIMHTSIKPPPVQTTARQNAKWFLSVDFPDLKYPTRWNLEAEKHDLTSGITSSRDTLLLYSLNCKGSLSHIFPRSKATGNRVTSPKSGPICFFETGRGKKGQPQILQQGCCVWSNLLPQTLAPVTHLLAKVAGGSE